MRYSLWLLPLLVLSLVVSGLGVTSAPPKNKKKKWKVEKMEPIRMDGSQRGEAVLVFLKHKKERDYAVDFRGLAPRKFVLRGVMSDGFTEYVATFDASQPSPAYLNLIPYVRDGLDKKKWTSYTMEVRKPPGPPPAEPSTQPEEPSTQPAVPENPQPSASPSAAPPDPDEDSDF